MNSSASPGPAAFAAATETPPLMRRLRLIVGLLACAALVSLAMEFGFENPPLPRALLIGVQVLAVMTYLIYRVYELAVAPRRREALRRMWQDGLLLLAVVVYPFVQMGLGGRSSVLKLSSLYIAVMQGALAIRLSLEAIRLNLIISRSALHPSRFMVLTFAGLITVGTLALALPRATTERLQSQEGFELGRHVLNCAFTATSATCVTGLTVYDTEKDFTRFGQWVILLLIQFGGLGIMVSGSLLGLLAQRQLSLRQSLAIQDAFSYRTLGRMRGMIYFIVVSTLTLEAVGAALLYPMFDDVEPVPLRVFYSVFHSVSAFCNAGFGLRSDNLIGYRTEWAVYASIMPLIVLGGLGFPVLFDLCEGFRVSIRRRIARRNPLLAPVRRHRLSLHSRLVLRVTLVLIVGGAAGIFAFETIGRPGVGLTADAATMRSTGIVQRSLDALFLSVSCRTAGFNTVAMSDQDLTPGTHMLSCVLMFIGGSPASTAGGIKTVALAVMSLGVLATMRGRDRVEAFGRQIPDSTVRRAAVLILVMFALQSTATMILAASEGATLTEAMFETVSAANTVGLSMGLTPELTSLGRLVIMAVMFAGRLGPLTMLIALAGESSPTRYQYPSEDVGIG